MAATSKAPNYDEDIDFAALALQDVDFAKVYDAASGKVDFQDPKALQQLTKSLLKRDFGLQLELPDDRLCPPVPVRYNYIRWMQDLLDTTTSSYNDLYDSTRKVTGLDIGTGASAIYALLASSQRPNWQIYATDIDSKSLTHATANVRLNALESRIHVRLSTPDAPLIPLPALGVPALDFVLCNPPFYASAADMQASHDSKSSPPSAVCTGAEVEMICPEGDAGFALRIVEESCVLGDRVQWYSSMLGKLSSVHVVVARLKEVGVGNWAVTSLRAGRKTRRWAVAWSFADLRPRNDVARSGELVQSVLPFPTAQTLHILGVEQSLVAGIIDRTLAPLDLAWDWRTPGQIGIGTAKENVWSRSARRKQKRVAVAGDENVGGTAKKDTDTHDARDQVEEIALAFMITVKEGEVEVRWLRGKDSVVFESFCGMLKRALRETHNNAET